MPALAISYSTSSVSPSLYSVGPVPPPSFYIARAEEKKDQTMYQAHNSFFPSFPSSLPPLPRSLFFDLSCLRTTSSSGALPFSSLDLIYGRWTSGLVTPNADGSPPSRESIQAISLSSAYIMVGVTFAFWIFSGGFFFCSESKDPNNNVEERVLIRSCLSPKCPSPRLESSLG